MTSRHTKQIVYGIFYLVVLLGLIAGIYFLFLKPPPSCFDGVQNQGELGIDSGGPCEQAYTPPGVKPIELMGRVLTLRTNQTNLSLLARISNPNLDNAAKNFTYNFSLYNSAGELARSFDGNSFLYAGEVKYILLPNENVPDESLGRVDFKIENSEWVPKAELRGPPFLSISGSATNISDDNLIVDGRIFNRDTVSFSKVTVVAIFIGQFGQVAGASQTEIENLAPNETRDFSVIHPLIPSVEASDTKVFVYALRL